MMRRRLKEEWAVLLLIIVIASFGRPSHAADAPPVPQFAKPQEGVFALPPNGYSMTVLELKDRHFRYWFRSDVKSGKEPQYPLTGEYSVGGDSITLQHDQIFEKQWTFKGMRGHITLWRPEALDYYNQKKGFDSYGILRCVEASADEVWADPSKPRTPCTSASPQ